MLITILSSPTAWRVVAHVVHQPAVGELDDLALHALGNLDGLRPGHAAVVALLAADEHVGLYQRWRSLLGPEGTRG